MTYKKVILKYAGLRKNMKQYPEGPYKALQLNYEIPVTHLS